MRSPTQGITWLSDYQVIKSPQSGIFRAVTKDGYIVAEGAVLGRPHGLFRQRGHNNTSAFFRGSELRDQHTPGE
jgi:hypothetical protein